jgi:hypothetical protein
LISPDTESPDTTDDQVVALWLHGKRTQRVRRLNRGQRRLDWGRYVYEGYTTVEERVASVKVSAPGHRLPVKRGPRWVDARGAA